MALTHFAKKIYHSCDRVLNTPSKILEQCLPPSLLALVKLSTFFSYKLSTAFFYLTLNIFLLAVIKDTNLLQIVLRIPYLAAHVLWVYCLLHFRPVLDLVILLLICEQRTFRLAKVTTHLVHLSGRRKMAGYFDLT